MTSNKAHDVVPATDVKAVKRDRRENEISRLLQIQEDRGRIPNDEVVVSAARLGVTPRRIRALVAERLNQRKPSAQPKQTSPFDGIPDEVLVTSLYVSRGDQSAARRYLQARGHEVPSERHFRRIVKQRVPQGLLEGARGGVKALARVQQYAARVIPNKGDSYAIDHMRLPIQVLPKVGKDPVFPWMTTVLDEKTRVVLSCHLSFDGPCTESSVGAIVEAVLGSAVQVGNDTVWIGGTPEAIHSDRGADLISEALTLGVTELAISRTLTAAYSSFQNGRVERFHRTANTEFFAGLPGYYPKGQKGYDERVGQAHWPLGQLLSLDQAQHLLDCFVHQYNTERIHSSLGCTPIESWVNDSTELRVPEAVEVVFALTMRKQVTLQHYGIDFEGRQYKSLNLTSLATGSKLEIRIMPGRKDAIWVIPPSGEPFLARRNLTAEEMGQMANHRARARRSYDEAIAEAHRAAFKDAGAVLQRAGFTDGIASTIKTSNGEVTETSTEESETSPAHNSARRSGPNRRGNSERRPRPTKAGSPVDRDAFGAMYDGDAS